MRETANPTRNIRPAPGSTPLPGPILQRKCACGGNPGASGECEECRKKRTGMLRRAAAGSAPASVAPQAVHETLHAAGQSLDGATLASMEAHFGHDFSRVRVHTDAQAGGSARAVNALAYTVGRHIVFGPGQFAPGTPAGRRLLAHELTHVVQQQDASLAAAGDLAIGDAGTAEERAAERMAESVSRPGGIRPGLSWTAHLPGRIQRQPVLAAPPKPGLAPGNEHVFSSPDGVKVVVFRKCGTAEFGFQKIEDATNQAFEKIFKTECISADRRAVLQKNLKQFGLKIFCKQPKEMELGEEECAESSPDGQVNLSSNTFSQNPNFSQLCAGGNLADVMLHEIMHATLGAQTEELPRSCENSCFGNDRGQGPELCANPKAANTRD
jgi:hypothetical protein